ncbi:carboxylesterase domain protein [Mycobacterium ulcerans str. Harvey]|uniref:Carboxylesterase domain protein n=1 Tax=Mycobacterium ulcerans str. Harvey TaxID=1299332 RepID=A0ABN0R0V0_MYCUL|nr:carboxylesterase domain protein [Mycobacterium ulcerans str. Harvey]
MEKTNIVAYGPHRRANLADIWRRRDLPRDGKARCWCRCPVAPGSSDGAAPRRIP